MTESHYSGGEFVVDVEDQNPDVAVVIKNLDKTLSQWEINPDDDTNTTVADENPNYDEKQSVILVSFVQSGLEKRWPEWRKHKNKDLYSGVLENGVKFYPFPEKRLDTAKVEEIAEAI